MYGEVVATRRLSPQLVRVVLGGDGLEGFAPPRSSDAYVNCFFVPDDAPYGVPFDDAVRELPREQRPFPRRITVRAWDASPHRYTGICSPVCSPRWTWSRIPSPRTRPSSNSGRPA
jgi:NADPH-dependent ferric siderophore reductase